MQATRRVLLQSLLAASVAGVLLPPRAHAARVRVGERAPGAMLTDFDGRRWSTAALGGQVVILTFWATWCSPCRDELPLLSAFAQAHRDAGLTVLGFTLDAADQRDEVLRIARGLSFPNGWFTDDSAPGYGRIWRLPANFTLGRDGRLAHDGWSDRPPAWTRERLEQVVAPLLA